MRLEFRQVPMQMCEARLEHRMVPRLEAKIELRLEQRAPRPHFALVNPTLTLDASGVRREQDTLERVVKGRTWGPKKEMLQMEAFLLDRWAYSNSWTDYLDSPLIAHVDAVLQLTNRYDAAVAIRGAGIPYGAIFELVGVPVIDVDFSHYKRHMIKPTVHSPQIDWLRHRKNVLLVDIDCVTGRTLRTVADYLHTGGVNVTGAYMGLSRWSGIELPVPTLGDKTIDFDRFWRPARTGLVQMKSGVPYEKGILPDYVILYGVHQKLATSLRLGQEAVRRVATYFMR